MESTPRILIVGPTPPPLGGMASVVEVCRDVIKTGARYEPLVIEEKNANPRQPGALNLANIALNFRLNKRLAAELRAEATALVHLHASVATTTTLAKNILLARTVKAASKPLVLQPHSGYIEQAVNEGGSVWKKMMTRLLNYADSVPLTSVHWQQLFEKNWPGLNYSILPNAVDINEYKPNAVMRESSGVQNVLFLGHIAQYKGLSELHMAWPVVFEALNGKCHLHIVGGPKDDRGRELENDLKTLAGVSIHGLVDNPVKTRLLQAADIFCLPSRFENLSIALLEAMACGCAPVTSAVGALPEVLADGCGITIPPRNSQALAEALILLLSDEKRRTEMGRRARERVVSEYSIANYSAKLHGIYDSLTATSH